MIIRDSREGEFRLKINLSFFSEEKTEKATPRKKQKSRSEGQVAISKEIATAITLIVVFQGLRAFSGFMYEKIAEVMSYNFALVAEPVNFISETYVMDFFIYIFTKTLIICMPIAIIAAACGFITNLIQVGWHPTGKPLKPKFDAFSPVNGLKRMFSPKQLVETFTAILKIALISFVIYSAIEKEVYQLKNIIKMDLVQGFMYIGNLCIDIGLKVSYTFIIIAILDFAYQRFSHNKKLKMSKQEVKDEYKQIEGDPFIKSKIRQKMREVALSRMMQDVPNADVVITNPTHFAVAIKYDREKEGAPIVVAKGADHLAKKIREVAKENKVEIVENKPLARALYASVEVSREIPPELYQAVAEVLAFVYKLKNKI